MRRGRGESDNTKRGATFSAARIAARVAELGRQISRAYGGKRLDVVITEVMSDAKWRSVGGPT